MIPAKSKRSSTHLAALLLALLVGLATVEAGEATRGARPSHSSLATLTPDGGRLLVVVPDLGSLTIIDTASHTRLGQVLVGKRPSSVAVSPSGHFAYVSNEGSHSVSVVDLSGPRALGEIPVGRRPTAVLANGDGRRIYVANRASADLTVLDARSFETLATLPLPPDPYSLSLSADGAWLYVVHLRPGLLTRVDTAALRVVETRSLGEGSYLATDLVPGPSGRGFLLHSRVGAPGPDGEPFGALPAVTVLDLSTLRAVQSGISLAALEPRPDFPRAGAIDAGETVLWVAAAGTDELLAVDLRLMQVIARVRTGANPRAVVPGPGGRFVYVVNALGPNVTVVDARRNQVVLTVPTGVLPMTEEALSGRRRYHNARLAQTSGGSACATCHLAGEGDGRVWTVEGQAVNTPALWGLGRQEAFGRRGQWHTLGQAAAHALLGPSEVGGGALPSSAQVDSALLSYLQSLDLPAGSMSGPLGPRAERGRALFRAAECGTCHSGPSYTDGRLHDVGTGGAVRTPPLVGLSTSAPYLHDGSAESLAQAVRAHQPINLTPAQEADLTSYLEGLPHAEAQGRPPGPGGGLRQLLLQLLRLFRR